MTIKIDKYFLEQELNAPERFNIYEEVQHKKSVTKKFLAYGLSLDRAVIKITFETLSNNHSTATLQDFTAAFEALLKKYTESLPKLS